MSRSVSMQFAWLTPEEAARFLKNQPKTADSVGDRIAAMRRLEPVTTPEERAAVRAFNEQREQLHQRRGPCAS